MKIDQLPPPFDGAPGVRTPEAPRTASAPSPGQVPSQDSARAPLTPLI